jgi:hypothetical protein
LLLEAKHQALKAAIFCELDVRAEALTYRCPKVPAEFLNRS